MPDILDQSFVDEICFVNLGRRGNRVELVKHLPYADVWEHLSEKEHHRAAQAPAVPEDTPVEIRMMRPEDSIELLGCVYRSYGYSCVWDYVYYPDRIRERRAGTRHSGDRLRNSLAGVADRLTEAGQIGCGLANGQLLGNSVAVSR